MFLFILFLRLLLHVKPFFISFCIVYSFVSHCCCVLYFAQKQKREFDRKKKSIKKKFISKSETAHGIHLFLL